MFYILTLVNKIKLLIFILSKNKNSTDEAFVICP